MLSALLSRPREASPDRDNTPTYNYPRAAHRCRSRPTSATTSPPAASEAHVPASRLGAHAALSTRTSCPEDNEHARANP